MRGAELIRQELSTKLSPTFGRAMFAQNPLMFVKPGAGQTGQNYAAQKSPTDLTWKDGAHTGLSATFVITALTLCLRGIGLYTGIGWFMLAASLVSAALHAYKLYELYKTNNGSLLNVKGLLHSFGLAASIFGAGVFGYKLFEGLTFKLPSASSAATGAMPVAEADVVPPPPDLSTTDTPEPAYKPRSSFYSIFGDKPPPRLSSDFGMRFHPVDSVWKHHAGFDFPVPIGTELFTPGPGTVLFCGELKGYGKTVIYLIENGPGTKDDVVAVYGHLSKYPPGIEPGAQLGLGDKIAYSGNTGKSTGPHLHFEVRTLSKNWNGDTAELIEKIDQYVKKNNGSLSGFSLARPIDPISHDQCKNWLVRAYGKKKLMEMTGSS